MEILRQWNGRIVQHLAPVLVFGYNRPNLLLQCLNALEKSETAIDSTVYIFIDGPKNASDKIKIEKIRSLETNKYGFHKIFFYFSEFNKGLANSIIDGIDLVLETYDSVIIVEDDLIVSEKFLLFCNESLRDFQNEEIIGSVVGYSPEFNELLTEPYFINRADCWGWATWKNRWELFERDAGTLLSKIQNLGLEFEFDFYGTFPYTEMLKLEAEGKIDSWAIRWQASMLINKKLSFYPPKSLILNLGFEGVGTHGTKTNVHNTILSQEKVIMPIGLKLAESKLGTELWMEHYKKITRKSSFHFFYKFRLILSNIGIFKIHIIRIWHRLYRKRDNGLT